MCLAGNVSAFPASQASTFPLNVPGAAWEEAEDLPTPLYNAAVATADGKAFLLGGFFEVIVLQMFLLSHFRGPSKM